MTALRATGWRRPDFSEPPWPALSTEATMTAVSEEPLAEDVGLNLPELVREHQVGIWRYLRFLGASTAEAEDLTQETFLAVARRPFDQRSPGQSSAYLRTVARNQLLMLRRKQKHEISTVELEMADSAWVQWAGSDGSLDAYIDGLEVCLEKLEGRARRAIDLHYRLGASRAAIATDLQMKPDGVKTLLRRTRQLLRECIERRLSSDNR